MGSAALGLPGQAPEMPELARRPACQLFPCALLANMANRGLQGMLLRGVTASILTLWGKTAGFKCRFPVCSLKECPLFL